MSTASVATGAVCADRSNLMGSKIVKAIASHWPSSNDATKDLQRAKCYGDENDPYRAETDQVAKSRASFVSSASTSSWCLGVYPEHEPDNRSMACDLVSDETLHGDDSSLDTSSEMSSCLSDVFVPVDSSVQDLLTSIRSAKQQEVEISPDKQYLHRHSTPVLQSNYITARMRNITAGWMVEVSSHFQLQPETLFLAINLLDRYLSKSNAFPRSVLQLLATTSVLVAAKQEEVEPPSVEVLTEIAANCFKQRDLLKMEEILLEALAWRVASPTPYTFLSLFSQAVQELPWDVFNLAAYFAELGATEYSMLQFPPSAVAAASLMLGCFLSGHQHLLQSLAEVSGYSTTELQGAICGLVQLHNNAFVPCSSEADVQAQKPLKTVQEKHVEHGSCSILHAPIRM